MFESDLISVIEKNMKDVKAAHDEYTDRSWKAKLETLTAGEVTPRKGVFYDDQNKNAYNNRVRELKRSTATAIDKFSRGISSEVSEAPSSEALRAVQMFSMMKPDTMSKEDYAQRIDDMMNRYGDSLVTYETLRSMAAAAGIHDFKPHKEIQARNSLEDLSRNVNRFFDGAIALNNNPGNVSDAAISFKVSFINGLLNKIGK